MKSLKYKKLILIIVVLLFNINNFAAIVSDNDGSAFVTKAEFDSLRQDFADQINNYNASIDGKVDGAIAAYLAGLRLQKIEKLNCLLDENGIYGKKYDLYWSGKTDKRVITANKHHVLFTINYSEYDYDASDDTQWGGNYVFPNILQNGQTNQSLDSVDVCRYYKIYNDDGVTLKETQLFYEKVKNTATFQLFFQFPVWIPFNRETGGTPSGYSLSNLLEANANDLKQPDMKNKLITYFRKFAGGYSNIWSVWKQCYGTIVQTESDTNKLVIAPFTTVKEKVWDLDNNTIDMAFGSALNTNITIPPSGVPTKAAGYRDINETTNWLVRLVVPSEIYLPWQLIEDTTNLKERKIKNLIDVSSANGTAANGVCIGQIPDSNEEMTLTVDVRAEALGTVYVYVGNDAITNWTDAAFKGKKVSITAINKKETITYENVSKKANVWVMFKNDNGDDKRLFIDNFYISS